MLLQKLILNNFKSFSAKQEIALAPITLIFGPNSAGKSSILQSLLLLKQTLEESENSESPIKPKGDLVDLGNFYRFVHNHDLERTVSIAPILTKRALRINSIPMLRNFSLDAAGVGISLRQASPESDVSLDEIAIYVDTTSDPAFTLRKAKSADYVRTRRLGRESRSTDPSTSTLYQLAQIMDYHPLWQRHLDTLRSASLDRAIRELDDNLGKLAQLDAATNPDLRRISGGPREYLRFATLDLEEAPRSRPTAGDLYATFSSVKEQLLLLSSSVSEYVRLIFQNNADRLVELRDFLPLDASLYRVRDDEAGPPFDAFRYLAYQSSSSRQAPLHPLVLATIISMALRRILLEAVYLGPLREYPERHYIYSGSKPKGVGKSGKLMADTLFGNPALVGETNARLGAFGIPYQLRLKMYRDSESNVGTADVFSLHLTDIKSDTEVGLVDVGFGVSQVLPIIVQCMLSSGSLIMIEQPELHLHPALQTELANLFVDSVKPPLNNQLIVETHSEHLMLRIQKLVRSGSLRADDVAVLYVEPMSGGSSCLRLRLDDEGDFVDEWPGGFFEESYRELFD